MHDRCRYNGFMTVTPINLRFRQRGLTLTETLTGLVLLGIGVLCIAAVYLERSQAAPAVLLHSKASRLADEMAVTMRGLHEQHFENPVGVLCQTLPKTATPQQRATNDVVCWQDKIAETLPNGTGAIDFDADSVPKAYLITVSWTPPRSGTASYLLRLEAQDIPAPTKPSQPAAATQARTQVATPVANRATTQVTAPATHQVETQVETQVEAQTEAKEFAKPAASTATRAAN